MIKKKGRPLTESDAPLETMQVRVPNHVKKILRGSDSHRRIRVYLTWLANELRWLQEQGIITESDTPLETMQVRVPAHVKKILRGSESRRRIRVYLTGLANELRWLQEQGIK